MNKNLLSCFPHGKTPRDHQIKLLQSVQEALNSDKKYTVINAPTGTGKSFIAATIANASKEPSRDFKQFVDSYKIWSDGGDETAYTYPKFGSAVLTVTKNLQDQYTKDFSDLYLLKGKSNYSCNYDNEYDVEAAPCTTSIRLQRDCWSCKRCSYYEDRNKSLSNKFGVFNYDVWLNMQPHARRKQILVCDEASELEGALVNFFSCEISYEEVENILAVKKNKYPRVYDEDAEGFKWLTMLHDNILNKFNTNVEILKDKTHPKYKKTSIQHAKLLRLKMGVDRVKSNWGENGENANAVEYIVERIVPDKYNKNIKEGISFTPFRVNKLAKHLFDTVDKVVLLSATIIDHKKELADLGISRDNYTYIEAPSAFDPKKSPIVVTGKHPLTFKVMDQNLPKVIEMAKKIVNHHKDDKGLIHTVSFKITKAVEQGITLNRLLFREGGKTNERLLEEHTRSEAPTVMVSPSMSHGVDLKGDLGKFQIIMKIPFLPLSSKRIKRLSSEDYNWYVNKTLSSLVQMAGRCTRTEDDIAITYIIDGSIVSLLQRNWNKLPKYFRDRIKTN